MTDSLLAEFHFLRVSRCRIVAGMSERFYVNCPLAPGLVGLPESEAHHLATVCRLGPGDAVCLFNGDGHEYPARVATVQRRSVEVEILGRETPLRELPFRLEIAAPLPKGDRAQFLVEKLTEMGVTSFVPLSTRRSVVHPREAKLDKLRRYVIEASKQCGRNRLMEISEVTGWERYVQRGGLPRRCWIGQVDGRSAQELGPGADNAVMVGPEGGWTDQELEVAKAHWRPVSLGPRTLRIETAAIAFAAILSNQQLSH
jgi:16S rRNA (uracil1498-N3)-methyltransferase